jgi:hypothetical protein
MPQTLPTPPGFSFGRLLGNLIAFVALLLAAAYLVDWLWPLFGGSPWATCVLASWANGPVGTIIGLVVFAVGVLVYTASGGKSGNGLALIVAGIIVGAASGVTGWGCQ